MVHQQRSRTADPHTTVPPTPTATDTVTGGLYEAGFSTTGRHPRAGIALVRTVTEGRERLADMLTFCDRSAPATADIVDVTRARTVAHHAGTVAGLFAEFNAGTPTRTVTAHPLTSPASAAE